MGMESEANAVNAHWNGQLLPGPFRVQVFVANTLLAALVHVAHDGHHLSIATDSGVEVRRYWRFTTNASLLLFWSFSFAGG
jgi:hypothetical protein